MTLKTTKARKGVPVTKRKAWHRPGDRWEWMGAYVHWAGPKRPRFGKDNYYDIAPDSVHAGPDHHKSHDAKRRRASLRRIALGGGMGTRK